MSSELEKEQRVFSSDVIPCYVTDKHGCSMKLSKIVQNEYFLPYFEEALLNFKNFPNFKAYSDDVVICGYPKCGTHWVWEVANMLVLGSAKYINYIKESVMLEALSDFSYIDAMERPRVLNTHLPPRFLPPGFLKQNSRLIYLQRKPKAVAVSMYNHVFRLNPMYQYTGTWDAYMDLFLEGNVDYGNLHAYIKEWQDILDQGKAYVINYENMKKDTVSEIKLLAEYLNVSVDDKLVREIAYNTEFHRMKEAKAVFDDEKEKSEWIDGEPMMYRKGEIDDWKNWFTVRQNEYFDASFEGTKETI